MQYSQLVCQNGHQYTDKAEKNSDNAMYCSECGETLINTCPSCNLKIKGDIQYDGIVDFFPTSVPAFCIGCGEPYPWTTRVLENAFEILSLDENLPKEQKKLIKLALPDLLVEKPSTPVAIAKYRKFIPKAATYVQDGLKNIFIDVVSETVKKSIWG